MPTSEHVLSHPAERKLLEKLLIDEESLIERLVESAQGLVGIDRRTGEPVILAPSTKLTDREKIFLLLLGKYFGFKLGKSKTDSFTTDDIANRVGLDTKSVSARISDLKRERAVETLARGEHRVLFANAESVLLGIRTKLKG